MPDYSEMYDRQCRISDWRQEKLSDSYVMIAGSNVLSNYLGVVLTGLGIGKILFADNERIGYKPVMQEFLTFNGEHDESKVKVVCDNLKRINPLINAVGRHYSAKDQLRPMVDEVKKYMQDGTSLEKVCAQNTIRLLKYRQPWGNPDVIVDATNDTFSKLALMIYSRIHKIPFISASSEKFAGSLASIDFRTSSKLPQDHLLGEYRSLEQHFGTSAVIAGVAAEYVRKYISPRENAIDAFGNPIKEGKITEKVFRYDILNTKRFLYHDSSNRKQALIRDIAEYDDSGLSKKLAVNIGGGSIGNFTTLQLALRDIPFVGIDKDDVAEANLSRQILFGLYDYITGRTPIGKYKMDVIRTVLETINPKADIKVIKDWFDRDFSDKYDVLIDGVDSFKARREEHYWSIKNRKPIIHGGTNWFSGQSATIVPGETPCFDCLLNVIESAEAEIEASRQSCIATPEPSVISTNEIIANLAANELPTVLLDHVPHTSGVLTLNTQIEQILKYNQNNNLCEHFEEAEFDEVDPNTLDQWFEDEGI